MDAYMQQQHLDLYFEDLARQHLPDPLSWPTTVFGGYKVIFRKDELANKDTGDIIYHANRVAALLDTVTVKFSLFRPDKEQKNSGVLTHWRIKTVVYNKLDKMGQAYQHMLNLQAASNMEAATLKVKSPGRPRKVKVDEDTDAATASA